MLTESAVDLPPEQMAQAMPILRIMRQMTMEVVTACHDPDPLKMQDNARDFFNRLETEALQLPLF